MSGSNGDVDALSDVMAARRARMVAEQLVSRDIRDPRVLGAMGRVERHRFVTPAYLENAYGDYPVPIGSNQTLSQPYIVALMTEALGLQGNERVLDVGTGSGYQTAILAELAREVFSVEILPELAARARDILGELAYPNVSFRVGDGREGWPEEAPFDGILVAAAPLSVPRALRDQLSDSGRLVLPVGPSLEQELERHTRDSREPTGFRVERLGAVRFVPLI
jgi:protein-L-isoaspartate(D-aspartate) O-methyltransferase